MKKTIQNLNILLIIFALIKITIKIYTLCGLTGLGTIKIKLSK